MLEEKTQSPLVVSAASGVCASSPNKAFLRPHLFFAHSTAIFLSNILHILFILYILYLSSIFSSCVAPCNIKLKQPSAVIRLYILYPLSYILYPYSWVKCLYIISDGVTGTMAAGHWFEATKDCPRWADQEQEQGWLDWIWQMDDEVLPWQVAVAKVETYTERWQ